MLYSPCRKHAAASRLLYAAQVRHGAAHNPQCRVVLLLRRSVGHKHGGAGNDIVVGAVLLGLYYPMSEGIAALDMGVIIPFLLGIAITVIALARAVNALFNRYYGIAYHCIIGFVIASTVPIIPVSFRSTSELIWSIVAATAGCCAAYFISRIDGLKE